MIQKRTVCSYKKGRNLLLAKQTKEEYLRNDMDCFSKNCSICSNNSSIFTGLLQKDAPFYVISDYETIDVFGEVLINKRSETKINNQIFLFSILNQLIENGKIDSVHKIYKMIKRKNDNVIFMDMFSSTVSSSINQNMSLEEKMFLILTNTVKFYIEHTKIPVIVLTKHEIKVEGATSMTIVEYADKFFNFQNPTDIKNLINSLCISNNYLSTKTNIEMSKHINFSNEDQAMDGTDNEYEDYENYTQLNTNDFEYHKGTIIFSKHKADTGYISINKNTRACINGKKNLNRALDGDKVVVQLYNQAIDEKTMDEMNDNDDDYMGFKSVRIVYAKVVSIMERKSHDFVATLNQNLKTKTLDNVTYHLFVPIDYKYPMVYVNITNESQEHIATLKNSRVILRFVSWDKASKHPICSILSVVGPLNNLYTDLHSMLISNDVSVDQATGHFDQASINSIENIQNIQNWSPELTDLTNRVDIRDSHMVLSIDPEGCQDIDDALSIQFLRDETFEIGVHIADVTSFFKYDSHLDLEARERATSIYLPHKRFDMLPTVLSANLCSLQPNVDRLALSIFWIVDSQGTILKQEIKETVIRSKYKLSYEEAERMLKDLEGKIYKDHVDLIKSMKKITDIFTHIRNKRLSNGAIEILRDEREVNLNDDKPNKELIVDNVVENMQQQEELLDIHKVIEEAMVLANTTIATYCFEKNSFDPDNFEEEPCVLLRNHPLPTTKKLVKLKEFADSIGMELDFTTIKDVCESLNKLTKYKDEPTGKSKEQLIKSLSIFAMEEAKYAPAQNNKEMASSDMFRHFGLALDLYTHFTSPIRRYSDIIVHHLVKAKLYNTNFHITYKKMEKITQNLNQKTRISKLVARNADEIVLNYYISRNEKEGAKITCDAYVTKLTQNRIHVFIPKYQLKAFLNLNTESFYTSMFLDNDQPCTTILQPSEISYGYDEEQKTIRMDYNGSVVILKEYDSLEVQLLSKENIYHFSTLSIVCIKKTAVEENIPMKENKTNIEWMANFEESKKEDHIQDMINRFAKDDGNEVVIGNSLYDEYNALLTN